MSETKGRSVVSLFSGAMGLDIGLEQAGIKASLAIEFDSQCCSTIRHNRPDLDLWETDVGKIDGQGILERLNKPDDVFLMVGGPPCQSFCPGGKRAALSDPRGNLIYTYLKLIQEIRPQFFVLENVANLVTAALKHRPIALRPGKHWNLSSYENKKRGVDGVEPMGADELSGSAIRQIVDDVVAIGYQIGFSIVDAAAVGAPQHRLRFVLFGCRDGSVPLGLPATHGDAVGLLPFQTVRDAIYDLRNDPGPHSEYGPEMARYFALVPAGGYWKNLPKELQREALGNAAFEAGGGKMGFFRRLSWDRPSPTITGKANRKGSALCHPEQVRPLSVRECARLQGFPDDWRFSGAMNRQYSQIGNAVPVHLGAAIGHALLDATRKKKAVAVDLDAAMYAAVKRLRSSARNKRSKNPKQPTLF